MKHKDRFAGSDDLLAQHTFRALGRHARRSLTGQRAAALDAARLAPTGPAETLPKKLAPMLAESGDARALRSRLALRAEARWLSRHRVHRGRTVRLQLAARTST